MALKRKRSFDFSSSSSSSSPFSSSSINPAQPPPPPTTFGTFTSYPLTKPFLSSSSSPSLPKSSHDQNPPHPAPYFAFNDFDSGRTRKRYRDARPKEQDIYKKTLGMLYEGAKRPVSPPQSLFLRNEDDDFNMDDDDDGVELGNEAIGDKSLGIGEGVRQLFSAAAGCGKERAPSPHQLSLHRFWGGGGGGRDSQQQQQGDEAQKEHQNQQEMKCSTNGGSPREEDFEGVSGRNDTSVERTYAHGRDGYAGGGGGGLELYLAYPGAPWPWQQGTGMTTAQRGDGLQAAGAWTSGVDAGDVVMA